MSDKVAADRKVAIITGGGQGIGRSIVLELAEIGVDVKLTRKVYILYACIYSV